MTPWYIAMLKSLTRAAMLFMFGWLADHNVWTRAEGAGYVDKLVPYVVPVLASAGIWLWQHRSDVHAKRALVTALQWAGVTENDVRAHIARGLPTPTVKTPPATIPGVPRTE